MNKINLNSPIYKDISETLVMGHFLPWFTGNNTDAFSLPSEYEGDIVTPQLESWRHWKDCRSEYDRTHLYQPLYGEYDSRNPLVIRRQINDAVKYGLDGFIININGKNSVENMIALNLLQEINLYNSTHLDKPFLYIISFDSKAQSSTEGKLSVSLKEDFEYLREVWLTDAWVRNGDKPILLIFAYNDNYTEYKNVAGSVFDKGADIVWHVPDKHLGVKSAYCWVNQDNKEWLHNEGAGTGYSRCFYKRCAQNPEIDYIIGGVWPGFNDSLVRWAWDDGMSKDNLRPRVICRNTSKGNTLELTWQEIVDYTYRQKNSIGMPPMPIVQIVTWNDWAESTAVEPDMESGYKNLEICHKYIKVLKNKRSAKYEKYK